MTAARTAELTADDVWLDPDALAAVQTLVMRGYGPQAIAEAMARAVAHGAHRSRIRGAHRSGKDAAAGADE